MLIECGISCESKLSLTSRNEGWTLPSVETNNRTFFQSHFRVRFCLFRQTEQFRGNNVFDSVVWKHGSRAKNFERKSELSFNTLLNKVRIGLWNSFLREGSRPEGFYSQRQRTPSAKLASPWIHACIITHHSTLH